MSGEEDDIPRTVVALNPGGRRTPPAEAARPQAPAASPAPRKATTIAATGRHGINPLIDAAGDLFELAVYLRAQVSPMDADALRERVVALVRRFEAAALGAGIDQKTVLRARYAVCATIDDVVLSSPWGYDAGWQRATLVSVLHDEVTAGEQFFKLLDVVRREPGAAPHLLEFLYACMSLGFKGRYRRDGALAELEATRLATFRDIETQRNGFAETLSLRIAGEEAERRPLRAVLPVWLLGGVSVAAMAGLFFFALSSERTALADSYALADAAPPRGGVEYVRAAPVLPPPPAPPANDIAPLRNLLQALIDEGIVEEPTVVGSGIRIIVNSVARDGRAMFGSGKAEITGDYLASLGQIGEALALETRGPVTVQGHSDVLPFRGAPYFSNDKLSEARAVNAATQLRTAIPDAARAIGAVGLGSRSVLDTGTTREAHARNRRIEIWLPVRGVGDRGSTDG